MWRDWDDLFTLHYSALAEEFIMDLYQSDFDNLWENIQKFYLMMDNLDLVQK